MVKCITVNKLTAYIKKLSEGFNVFYPVKIGNKISFTNDLTKLSSFHLGLSHIPPKEFFLPAFEDISLFYKDDSVKVSPISHKKSILFGVHPLDIRALSILQKLMQKKYPDYYWDRRRKNYYIIGIGDYLFKDFFDCDIFLESNSDTYDVILRNPTAKILLDYRGLFNNSTFEKEKVEFEHDPIFADPMKLSFAVEQSYNSSIWDDLAKIDLGCGNCSFTCPLCYCFETYDELKLQGNCKAKRCRRWSSCFHADFFEISGHNPRSKLRDRIYNWYYHKFVRFPREVGHVGCVDCGRCISSCPAKINYKHVLKSILDEYEKSLY